MPNFTIEDYKEAIRAKYEKDINNPLSCAPTSLGQAYLRDFCWQKFEGGLIHLKELYLEIIRISLDL